jgi:cyanophycinase-like exopeptidase
MEPGPLALVGSGEYLPSMLEIERTLIDGRPPRYVQIPTAASREGQARLAYWVDLGKAQAARLGVEAVPLVVTSRDAADDPAFVDQVTGAGLIYLSGGDPGHLADVLRDTALWRAIVAAWQGGAALAGCSAGAMVMAANVPDFRRGNGRPGLGLLPNLQVLPHFDKMAGWMPDFLTRPFLRHRDGVTLVGIDEETALVGGVREFTVTGRRSAWILGDGPRQRLAPGETLVLEETAP